MITSSDTSDTTDAMRPRVLFVGDDASSPQIAASLLQDAAGDRIAVATASTQPVEPGGRPAEILVAMGLNPAAEERLSVRELHIADRVVVLGADIDVARLPGPQYEEWDLEQDNLVGRVEALSEALTAPPQKRQPAILGLLAKARDAIRRRRSGSKA